jgi:predicted metalloprotease with PDZ domain
VGDEILAFDEDRIPPHGLIERLRGHRPGEAVSLLVARRDRLRRLPLVFGERPRPRGAIEVDPTATLEQLRQLASWWRGIPVGNEAEAAAQSARR